MRITPEQADTIEHQVHRHFGPGARVSVFGSRLDDGARGGDIDLLVETDEQPSLWQRARATMALEQALGLPVDIVAVQRGDAGSAFVRMARARAHPLAAGEDRTLGK